MFQIYSSGCGHGLHLLLMIDHIFKATLAVRGTCGMHMATGALCLCGKSLGGEIFACINTECYCWIKSFKVITLMEIFKAALINIFILTMEQITLCNGKRVTHNDEPKENYYLALHFPSALVSIFSVF